LLTLAAVCPKKSGFLTQQVTDHLLTNAAVIRAMTGRRVEIEARRGRPGMVVVEAAEVAANV